MIQVPKTCTVSIFHQTSPLDAVFVSVDYWRLFGTNIWLQNTTINPLKIFRCFHIAQKGIICKQCLKPVSKNAVNLYQYSGNTVAMPLKDSNSHASTTKNSFM
jgi:hypothetical protein